MIHAIIFDMDGLLIDTEPYHTASWQRAAREMGYDMEMETAYQLRSLAGEFAGPMMKDIYGKDFHFEELHQRKRKIMDELLADSPIKEKRGAKELLGWLSSRGWKRAVATATRQEKANEYLEACKRIGEKPENCLALEDSPNGAWAGVRAGCKTIMVPDLTPVLPELKDKIWKEAADLLEVKQILGSLVS